MQDRVQPRAVATVEDEIARGRKGILGRWKRAERGDRLALIVLIGVPLVLFALPALAGYPLLTGDDVIENLPLRELAGQMIRHGMLPIYNPYSWGGTPLLGSIDGGLLSPDVLVFAVLPGIVAWVITETAAYATAMLGLFVFLRLNRVRSLPSTIGAVSFGLLGFLSSQAVHLGVVETGAGLAWMFVGLVLLGRPNFAHRVGAGALFALACAGAVLAGNPETAFYGFVAVGIYAVHLWSHLRGRDRRGFTFHLLIAIVTGGLLAAIEIVPGALFVQVSQRASTSYSYLTSGSLVPSHLIELVAPHLLGGGPIGLSRYVGTYNLAETDAYLGIFSLVALFALLPKWRSTNAVRWRVFYLIGACGLVLAMGDVTPIPHLLERLPVIGESRLPSRALLCVSLSSSVLCGFWCDEFLRTRSDLAANRTRHLEDRSLSRRRVLEVSSRAIGPLIVLLALLTVAIGRDRVAAALGGQSLGPWDLARVAPYLVTAGLLALAVLMFVLGHEPMSTTGRTRLLVVLFVVDVVLFTANQSSFAPIALHSLDHTDRSALRLAQLSRGGRFVIYDPQQSGGIALDGIGPPNLNVETATASAQGYGSLSWGPYARLTGTHGQDVASPSFLGSVLADELDVTVVLARRASFEVDASSVYDKKETTLVSRSEQTSLMLGGSTDVRSITLSLPNSRRDSKELDALARGVTLVSPSGSKRSAEDHVIRDSQGVTVNFAPTRAVETRAVEISIAPTKRVTTRVGIEVTTMSGRTFSPTGVLSSAISGPRWVDSGSIGPYEAFSNVKASGQLQLVDGRDARVTRDSISSFGAREVVSVTSRTSVRLVRSVANIPGWTATIESQGTSKTATPTTTDLVQQILLPSGRSRVTFAYTAPGSKAGAIMSGLGVVILLASVLYELASLQRGASPPSRSEYERKL